MPVTPREGVIGRSVVSPSDCRGESALLGVDEVSSGEVVGPRLELGSRFGAVVLLLLPLAPPRALQEDFLELIGRDQ